MIEIRSILKSVFKKIVNWKILEILKFYFGNVDAAFCFVKIASGLFVMIVKVNTFQIC